jgi:hypothetical protein
MQIKATGSRYAHTCFAACLSVVVSYRQRWSGAITKTLRVMRLTALLLLVFFVHVSAKSISQTITFSGRAVSLEKAFTVIRTQTGYFVTGNKQLLQQAHSVTLDVQEMPLPNFLDMLLKDQPLTWRMEAQTIFIVEKAPVALPSILFLVPPPPPTEISGRILDPNGSPISGRHRYCPGNA